NSPISTSGSAAGKISFAPAKTEIPRDRKYRSVIAIHTTALAERTRKRINRRLMPFLFVLYIIAFLDRINISFAGLDMTRELGFSDRVFGFGSGIFFVGYVLLEIPGSLLVELWSARKGIARIMISWGRVASFRGRVNT